MKNDITNFIYKQIKDEKWFKQMGLDQRGEFCRDLAEQLDNVAKVAIQAAIHDLHREEKYVLPDRLK